LEVAGTVNLTPRVLTLYGKINVELLYFYCNEVDIMNGLRQLREQHMMTQREVALSADVTVTTLSRIENGKVKPSLSTIRNLAKVFNIPPQEMRSIILSGQLPL
jgi:DNA-binding XRE family transcriptional regulator